MYSDLIKSDYDPESELLSKNDIRIVKHASMHSFYIDIFCVIQSTYNES